MTKVIRRRGISATWIASPAPHWEILYRSDDPVWFFGDESEVVRKMEEMTTASISIPAQLEGSITQAARLPMQPCVTTYRGRASVLAGNDMGDGEYRHYRFLGYADVIREFTNGVFSGVYRDTGLTPDELCSMIEQAARRWVEDQRHAAWYDYRMTVATLPLPF